MPNHAELLEWISDLQTGLYINCVYCGYRYGPKTEEIPADALRRHIATCAEHPMSKLLEACKLALNYVKYGSKPHYNNDQSFRQRVKSQLKTAIEEATK